MASLVDQLGAAAAVEVDFRTAHTPPVRWTPDDDEPTATPAPGAPSGGPSWSLRTAFLRWLRPELTVRSGFGTYHSAPHGPAGVSSWPLVPAVLAVVLLVVVGLAVVGAVTGARWLAGRTRK